MVDYNENYVQENLKKRGLQHIENCGRQKSTANGTKSLSMTIPQEEKKVKSAIATILAIMSIEKWLARNKVYGMGVRISKA